MKRMAALFAVMGAMSAVVPATAPAAEADRDVEKCLTKLIALRIC